jgi:hypothetical protein
MTSYCLYIHHTSLMLRQASAERKILNDIKNPSVRSFDSLRIDSEHSQELLTEVFSSLARSEIIPGNLLGEKRRFRWILVK